MRFRKQLWPVIAVAVVVLGFSQHAVFAQGVDDPNGVFQLEGNAMKDASVCFPSLAAPPCSGGDTLVTFGANTDDWASLTHALATTGIITDPTGHADDILSGGGSKDIYDFSKWAWKQTANTSVQAKDDIAHAFAAAYQLANGHTAIYFGMDRFDNSGDATAGFWFLQDATVSTNSSGGFNGHHMDGDLLIVSDFSTGGAVSTINVFKWVGGANGSLVLNETRSPAPCDPRTDHNDLCAIVNPVDGITSPWGFLNKSGESTFGHGEFLEGGIDLNSVFGSSIPCFTTFMGETRASTSPTSTLSDFIPPHSFPLCGIIRHFDENPSFDLGACLPSRPAFSRHRRFRWRSSRTPGGNLYFGEPRDSSGGDSGRGDVRSASGQSAAAGQRATFVDGDAAQDRVDP